MSRGLALLFGAGATLVIITLLLPHGHGEARVTLLIPAGLAYVVVALLLAAPSRFPEPALHAILALGTALVGLCVLFSGRAGAAYAFMFVWVALYASAFFSVRASVAHVAWVGAVYAIALIISGDVHPPGGHWLLAVGTSAVAATLIQALSREVRGRAEDLEAVTGLANELGGASEVSSEHVAGAVCDGVRASTRASAVLLLEEDPGATALHVLGQAGNSAGAATFDGPGGLAALDEAYRTGRPARVRVPDGTIAALVQPVLREGRVGGLLAVAWERPRRRLSARVEASVALFAAEAGVALERIVRQSHDRERRALELNDEIVQGLVVAKYALRDGRVEIGEKAIAETLDRARALVDGQLESLHGTDAPEPGTLRREGRGIG
jgi:hypothetical protein